MIRCGFYNYNIYYVKKFGVCPNTLFYQNWTYMILQIILNYNLDTPAYHRMVGIQSTTWINEFTSRSGKVVFVE